MHQSSKKPPIILCYFMLFMVFPALIYSSVTSDWPKFFGFFSNQPAIISYNFKHYFSIFGPFIIFPLEVIGLFKIVLKKDLPQQLQSTLEKFMLYFGITIIITSPFAHLAMKHILHEKGYQYCEEKSDLIWHKVYVLDDALCTKK